MRAVTQHKRGIARSFDRAAAHYDSHAAFQRRCGERLMQLAGPQQNKTILDAGCGTGWFSRQWQQRGNRLIGLDLSADMLAVARRDGDTQMLYVNGDMEQLPLSSGSVDMVFSNLAVQWCDDLPAVLAECYRVVRPGGLIALSTLSSGSLLELDLAWSRVDDAVHRNSFLSSACLADHFAAYRHQLHHQRQRLHYPCLRSLLMGLKGVGAGYLRAGRSAGLGGKAALTALEAAWPRDQQGLLLSYHLTYGIIYRD